MAQGKALIKELAKAKSIAAKIISLIAKAISLSMEYAFIISCVIIFGSAIVWISSQIAPCVLNDTSPDAVNVVVTAILSSAVAMVGLIEFRKKHYEKRNTNRRQLGQSFPSYLA